MKLDDDILSILVCPDTKQRVQPLDPDQLDTLNRAISKGEVNKRAGDLIREPLEDGFIREDHAVVYPVRDGIPVFLIDEALLVSEVL